MATPKELESISYMQRLIIIACFPSYSVETSRYASFHAVTCRYAPFCVVSRRYASFHSLAAPFHAVTLSFHAPKPCRAAVHTHLAANAIRYTAREVPQTAFHALEQ